MSSLAVAIFSCTSPSEGVGCGVYSFFDFLRAFNSCLPFGPFALIISELEDLSDKVKGRLLFCGGGIRDYGVGKVSFGCFSVFSVIFASLFSFSAVELTAGGFLQNFAR